MRKEFIATEPDQIHAMKSRLRGRICDVVYHMGRATVHEIADRLATPVSSLYDHLEILVEAGLLLEGEPVRTTKNFARTVVAPAKQLRFSHNTDDRETRIAIADVVASQLRFAEKETRAAIVERGDTVGRADSVLRSGSTVGWLSKADIRRLNELLTEVESLFERGTGPEPGRSLQALTVVSRPVG
ncbi:MAG: putative transcriptional regulator [Phycisphaerales bacterium]|jgi:predicted transcriptional regulator